jgi:hypothetical protein
MPLGDLIAAALDKIGLTKGRVEAFLGRPCGCTERQEKLNALSHWAHRVLSGKVERATEHLDRLTDPPDAPR